MDNYNLGIPPRTISSYIKINLVKNVSKICHKLELKLKLQISYVDSCTFMIWAILVSQNMQPAIFLSIHNLLDMCSFSMTIDFAEGEGAFYM